MKKGRVISAAAIALACTTVLAACGGSKSSSSATSNETAKTSSGKTKVTWMAILQNPTPPTNTVINKLEDATKTDITFNWLPAANYEERLTTSLASGQLADIVTVAKMGNSTVRSSEKNGVFWNVEPYLKDYPNLKQIPKSLLDSVRVDGKVYGVPMQKNLSRSGFAIRQDWLKKVGLKTPTTMDELYKVAQAFTEDDPDGDGKKDTVGIEDRSFNDFNFTSFKQFATYYGAPNAWGRKSDGTFYRMETTKAYKKAMDFYKKLYQHGYVNKDFAVMQKSDQNNDFSMGKYGIYPGAGMTGIVGFEQNAKGTQDSMDLVPVNKISADGSKNYRVWAEGNGFGGLLAIPKSNVKSVKRLKQILAFIDKLYNKKEFMLMTYGIKGVHYTVNAKGEVTQTNMDKYTSDVQALTSSRPTVTKWTVKSTNKKQQEVDKLTKENEKYAVLDPSIGAESDTYNQVGSEIQKVLTDATVKYIMGQIDYKEFQAQFKDWQNQGGAKIAKEFTASYNENHK